MCDRFRLGRVARVAAFFLQIGNDVPPSRSIQHVDRHSRSGQELAGISQPTIEIVCGPSETAFLAHSARGHPQLPRAISAQCNTGLRPPNVCIGGPNRKHTPFSQDRVTMRKCARLPMKAAHLSPDRPRCFFVRCGLKRRSTVLELSGISLVSS